MANAYVYILASQKNGTLYVGVTNDLYSRLEEHRSSTNKHSFTAKYSVFRLVHFETFDDIRDAIQREKRIKKWNRQWKIDLIKQNNPGWRALPLNWDD